MTSAPDDVAAALAQMIDKVRRMSPSRLREIPPGESQSPVDAARALARNLAIVTQGIEQAASSTTPAWRDLPDVPDLVVGDQLAVLAHDLRSALAGAPAEVWTTNGRAPLADVVQAVVSMIAKTSSVL